MMKILVCYDGSNVAREALELAKKHLKIFGGFLFVVTSMKGGPDVPKKEFERAESELKSLEADLHEEGIPCETHLLVRGLEAGEDLVLFARERDVEEIVIGVRRRSRVGKFLFGSTAQFVILEARCPVVTVR
jgi:nucleotide-binding universal stress UspA family protein